jgi:hypothetical protein
MWTFGDSWSVWVGGVFTNKEVPPGKERKWLDPQTYVELGIDGRLRLFRRVAKKFVLVKESEETYDRLSWWSITDAFPDLTWKY